MLKDEVRKGVGFSTNFQFRSADSNNKKAVSDAIVAATNTEVTYFGNSPSNRTLFDCIYMPSTLEAPVDSLRYKVGETLWTMPLNTSPDISIDSDIRKYKFTLPVSVSAGKLVLNLKLCDVLGKPYLIYRNDSLAFTPPQGGMYPRKIRLIRSRHNISIFDDSDSVIFCIRIVPDRLGRKYIEFIGSAWLDQYKTVAVFNEAAYPLLIPQEYLQRFATDIRAVSNTYAPYIFQNGKAVGINVGLLEVKGLETKGI